MKNFILTIFLGIVFGFSNIPQQAQNAQWFWDNYIARQINRLFDFQSNPGQQKQYQIMGKTSPHEISDK